MLVIYLFFTSNCSVYVYAYNCLELLKILSLLRHQNLLFCLSKLYVVALFSATHIPITYPLIPENISVTIYPGQTFLRIPPKKSSKLSK